MDINKAFGLLLKQEGITTTIIEGDRGGLTKYGIASASHPGIDIANLTLQQAQDIYEKEYWEPCKCDSLIPELQYAHFSAAVNCGPQTANMILQKAAGVKPDGVIGALTLTAATKVGIALYCDEWQKHYDAIIDACHERNDVSQDKFIIGWGNRVKTILNWFNQGLLT